jgi:drug/metabolite transporter (DMT)-like permease
MDTRSEVADVPFSRSREHRAVLMLLIACAVWGMGFNWNKTAQALLGQSLANTFGDASLHSLGPAAFLAIRFSLAAMLWMMIFPRSLRGWSRSTWIGGASGGLFLAGGMLLQHYGLSHTSESLSSFLTSLTVLFTPLICFVFLRQSVAVWLWVSVICATCGVILMTLHGESASFDRGALLGLLCAVAFSVHILIVDRVGKREDPWRFTLAQFVVASAVYAMFAFFWPGGRCLLRITEIARTAVSAPFLVNLLLTTLPGTILTFGLMFRYQPDMSPTRAALTYLSESIFATAYAWIVDGKSITMSAMLGAGLILAGNVLAELLGKRRNSRAAS